MSNFRRFAAALLVGCSITLLLASSGLGLTTRQAAILGKSVVGSISVPATWTGTCSSVSPCTATSQTQTLTVPPGNPGTLKFRIDVGAGAAEQYSKNGGAFTTFSNNATVTFANGDTLAFQATSLAVSSGSAYTIIDNTTNATVNTVDVQNTHP